MTTVHYALYFMIAGVGIAASIFVARSRRRTWIASGRRTGLRPYANAMTNVVCHSLFTLLVLGMMVIVGALHGTAAFVVGMLVQFVILLLLAWSYRNEINGVDHEPVP